MSQALRKLTGSVARSKCLIVFINQIRMKIGVMFGSPETTSGGNALKFYASVRMDIRRIGAIKDGDEVVGNQTRVKVVKNKVAPPFKIVEFDIMYGEGISKAGELLDLGVKAGVVEKSGSWFSYDSERIGQGRENAKQYLKEHADVAARIEIAIRTNAGLVSKAMMVRPDDEAAEAAGADESAEAGAADADAGPLEPGDPPAARSSRRGRQKRGRGRRFRPAGAFKAGKGADPAASGIATAPISATHAGPVRRTGRRRGGDASVSQIGEWPVVLAGAGAGPFALEPRPPACISRRPGLY